MDWEMAKGNETQEEPTNERPSDQMHASTRE